MTAPQRHSIRLQAPGHVASGTWAAAALLSLAACMQVPGAAPTADATNTTSTAATAIVPTADGAAAAGGGSPASKPASTGAAISPGNLQGAQASMTIASHDATDLCLTVSTDANKTSPTLVLRSCLGSVTQRWVLLNGLLQSAQGGCLTLAASGADTTSPQGLALRSCNGGKDGNQQILVLAGAITVGTAATTYTLSTGSVPTTGSVVQFLPGSPNGAIGTTWEFGQYGHSDAGAALFGGTALVALELDPSGCLSQNTATNQLSYVACSAADTTQAWRLLPPGTLQNSGSCLDAAAPLAAVGRCTGVPSQLWAVNNGLLVSGGNCLITTMVGGKVTPSIGQCDLAAGPHHIFGLSL